MPIVAGPVTELRRRLIISSFSTSVSLRIGMLKLLLVSPGAKVKVPDVGV